MTTPPENHTRNRKRKSGLVTPDGELITAIIYHDGLPHTVFAGTDGGYSEFDFEWCEAEGVLAYHESGIGPGSGYVGRYMNTSPANGVTIWLRPRLPRANKRFRRRCSRIPEARQTLQRLGYKRITSPHPLTAYGVTTVNPFEYQAAQEGRAEWCSQCNAWRFDDGGLPCDHEIDED